jgi:hypothetical protein
MIQWTNSGAGGADASYYVPAALPNPLYAYNSDVAAQALVDHYAGKAVLADDALMSGAGGGCGGAW